MTSLQVQIKVQDKRVVAISSRHRSFTRDRVTKGYIAKNRMPIAPAAKADVAAIKNMCVQSRCTVKDNVPLA